MSCKRMVSLVRLCHSLQLRYTWGADFSMPETSCTPVSQTRNMKYWPASYHPVQHALETVGNIRHRMLIVIYALYLFIGVVI